jgi:F-type H+-transporting ATPase subunit delta
MQNTLAARYARALADTVHGKEALEKTAGELEFLSGVFRGSKALRDFLLNPAFPTSRKEEALREIAREGGLSAGTVRLVHILLERRRIDLLPGIGDEFRRIEEQILNRVSVEVTTAVPLDAALRRKLAESLEKFTGKSVRLEAKVDPALLGGARTQIGSTVYDGTVAARLRKLRQQLIGER